VPAALAFDVGSTLIHPDLDVLAELIGPEAVGIDRGILAAAFAYALEADQRVLPHGDRGRRQGEELLRLLEPHGHPSPERSRAVWQAVHGAGGSRSTLYTELDPDAHCVLSGLRANGCKLVAASNSDGTLDDELDRFGLLQYFDVVVDSHQIGVEKPDVRFFSSILAVLGRRDGTLSWYIGNDLVRDVLGALFGGFDRAAFYDRADAYPGLVTTHRIRRLSELTPLVIPSEVAS
jgi:FMN phosphatase YigB (HAD superfamily)